MLVSETEEITMHENEVSQSEAVVPDCETIVAGEPLETMPDDLYIPPGALRVFLETFQGPLDLLLYLIKKQNLDILDIPIADITKQYVSYVDMMQSMQLELAAEYLVMAAMLAEIKSRMLLPKLPTETEEEGDPRAELIRRLQEYERFKTAAENLDNLARYDRDFFSAHAKAPKMNLEQAYPALPFDDLLAALKTVLNRAKLFTAHLVKKDTLSVREKMTTLLSMLSEKRFVDFSDLFTPAEGKMGVVVTFIAVLELGKQSMLEITQNTPFGSIYIKAKTHE